MRSETLQAFVLSSLDYGESDQIVSLFTLEHGRIKGFARSSRKSRKRFGAALELLARIEVQAHCKEGLSTLQQADTRSVFPVIRNDLTRIALALYSAELLDLLTPEGQPLPRLFRLFSAWLERLEDTTLTSTVLAIDRRFFEINLLNILGYRPATEQCPACGEEYGESGALLQTHGELACRSCARLGLPITSQTLLILQRSLQTGSFGKITFSSEGIMQAGRLLDDSLAHHAGRAIKSLDFMRQVAQIET